MEISKHSLYNDLANAADAYMKSDKTQPDNIQEKRFVSLLKEVRRDRTPIPVELIVFTTMNESTTQKHRFYAPQSSPESLRALSELSETLGMFEYVNVIMINALEEIINEHSMNIQIDEFHEFLMHNMGRPIELSYY